MNKDKQKTLLLMKELMPHKEKELLKSIDQDILKFECLGLRCSKKHIITLVEYKTKEVICPGCNQIHNVRVFKNGKVKITRNIYRPISLTGGK